MKRIDLQTYIIIFAAILLGLPMGMQPVLANPADMEFNGGELLSESELSKQSGQGGVMLTNAQLSNNVININSSGNLINGNNVLSDNALNNVNGITSVIQNSGNNVIIQNSMIVNVNFH